MSISLSESVKTQFDKKSELTVWQLYEILESEFPSYEPKILKHRIRATINALRVSGYLIRVGYGKWKKLTN